MGDWMDEGNKDHRPEAILQDIWKRRNDVNLYDMDTEKLEGLILYYLTDLDKGLQGRYEGIIHVAERILKERRQKIESRKNEKNIKYTLFIAIASILLQTGVSLFIHYDKQPKSELNSNQSSSESVGQTDTASPETPVDKTKSP